MTAEGYFKKHYAIPKNVHGKEMFDYMVDGLTYGDIIELMDEYANLKKSEWCKEQREICAEKYKTLTYDSTSVWAMTVIAIRNAPEPKGETE